MNDKKLQPMQPFELKEGDTVQLGVKTTPEEPAEFLFKYYKSLKVKRVPSNEDRVDGHIGTGPAKRVKLDNGVRPFKVLQ